MLMKPGATSLNEAASPRLRSPPRKERSTCGTEDVSRWSLNGDFLTLPPNGVARHAREVVSAMDALIGEAHPLTRAIELDMISPVEASLSNIPVHVLPEYKSPRIPQAWVQGQLPRHVEGGLVSFCNLAPVWTRRHIVCIHDLHTFLMPESYPLGFRLAHRAILPMLGRRAAAITTVSEFSKQHLVSAGIASADRITVTGNGSDHVHRWNASRGTCDLDYGRPFVLCLGQPQPYKNLRLILDIAPALERRGISVLVAGAISNADLTACNGGQTLPGNVRRLGRISDDDLAQAYSQALCFLFPSRIEGFGLPAVEAMALGCPLIASTAPCLREICGSAAVHADPDDPQAWIDAIVRLRDTPRLAGELSRKGRLRAQAYSWRRIALTYFRLMSEIPQESRRQKRDDCELEPA